MKKGGKTNAVRLLEQAKIAFSLASYTVDESDLSAVHVASELDEEVARVFKTLVAQGDKTGHIVFVIPAAEELDLKKAAKVSGNKKVELMPMKDLLGVTGYIRGGCSPIGMKKRFPTYFHVSCTDYDTIYVSGGIRGLQIIVNAQDLMDYVGAAKADIIV